MSVHRRHIRLIGCGIAAASSLATSSAAFAQPALPGWTPAWSDEFDGTTLDTSRWEALDRKDSYNNEKQYYTPGQVSVSGGTLKLTASNVPLGGKAYRSGLVRTWAEQTYGRWEIRASLPATQGMWPAIWLLPRYVDWPSGGEIDIMENRGRQPTIIGNAYHYGSSVANHRTISREFSYRVNGSLVNFHNSMHDYAVEWDASRIRYFIDGIPTLTFYRNAAPISSSPMSLILNLAVGGDYGGDPNGSTVFPQTLAIDHVRVFDRDTYTSGLDNASFETRAGTLFTAWDEYSNGSGSNVVADSVGANARTGSGALQVFGRFDGTTENRSGVFQEVPTTPGEVWQVGTFSRNRPGDVLAGENNARIKLEFINDQGAVIGTSLLTVANAGTPAEYREAVLRAEAPAGSKFARAVLEMQQLNNAGGAVNFDDASLRRWTSAVDARDVNLDGVANAADLDALLHSLSSANSAFDYNNDLAVNGADVDALLAAAFLTRRGDSNLDQAVNFDDLLTLSQNYGRTGTGRWALGDFNGDSSVNFDDLLALAQNYGAGPALDASFTPDFASDWALARSLVPEPTTALLSVAALPALLLRRRSGAPACNSR